MDSTSFEKRGGGLHSDSNSDFTKWVTLPRTNIGEREDWITDESSFIGIVRMHIGSWISYEFIDDWEDQNPQDFDRRQCIIWI